MTAAADIDALTDGFMLLRGALDSGDATLILEASRKVALAVDAVRGHGAWRADAQLRAKLEALIPLMESARIRINVAADDLRRRISLLADRGGNEARVTYGTYGR